MANEMYTFVLSQTHLNRMGAVMSANSPDMLDWARFLISKDVQEKWSEIKNWWSAKWTPQATEDAEPELPQLLIIGPGGVGKTTLAKFLSGDFSTATEPGSEQYLESLITEEFESKSPPASIIVAPGQKHRREIHWRDLESGLAAGRFSGVILVVSYGYHSIGELPLSSLSGATRDEVDVSELLEKYCAECRKEELRVAERLLPFISRAPNKLWLLTVVTKQDLWDDRNQQVRDHYLTGEFGKAVRKLIDRQAPRIQFEMAFTCLIPQNFRTGRNELLQNTIAGFDQVRYNHAVIELLTRLAALRKWESES